MSEMVDRVASALYGGNIEDSYFPAWFRRKARQVIEVMREPNDEMYNGVNKLDKMWRDSNSFEIWRAMIDGILAADVPRETIR